MTNRIPLAIAAVAAIALAGCDRDEHHGGDSAKIASDIKAQEAKWQQAYAARDLGALADMYADDAALADPGAALATTSGARRKEIQTLTTDPNLKLTFASDRVQVAKSGDLAYSRGHFTIQATDRATNKPVTSEGNYLTVWQRHDGDWKAVEDFVTPGPAPAAAAPAAPAAK
jgi:ketosteroid isomerase-like protein